MPSTTTQSTNIIVATVEESAPLFVGVIFNYLFTGILIHQLFDYNKNYPNDRLALKCLVYGVFFLDVLQTGFTTQFSWLYCVQDRGAVFTWTASMLPFMAGLTAMIVQLYYARRIWVLGGLWLKSCSVVIVMVAFLECLCAFIGGIKYDFIGSGEPTDTTVPFFATWLAGSFTCDVLIAGCMTMIFVDAKTRSYFEATNSILNILIRHVVETAAVTAFSAGLDLAFFVADRNKNFSYSAVAFVLGKLYSNCLLANLNNRKHILSSGSDSDGSDNLINSFRLRKLRKLTASNNGQTPAVVNLTGVKIDQTLHVQRDEREGSLETTREVDVKQFNGDGNFSNSDASDAFAYTSKA